uniref:Uncharacterized protein n=1 Tax=Castor canadensis TaxID=51338 RepID=A0A8C0ZTI7_CASCN
MFVFWICGFPSAVLLDLGWARVPSSAYSIRAWGSATSPACLLSAPAVPLPLLLLLSLVTTWPKLPSTAGKPDYFFRLWSDERNQHIISFKPHQITIYLWQYTT